MIKITKIFHFSKIFLFALFIYFMYGYLQADEIQSNIQDNTTESSEKSDKNDKTYKLNAVTATGSYNQDLQKFQSGNSINSQVIEDNPSGNGDITSILRIIPNVQYDNAQLKSTTPGEIDPANVSISGGLFYQNNFQLDGFNMNNDLDPNGGSTHNINSLRSGRSQGLAIDSSLLDSITVQDSNVSAAYGRFTGGVIEATVRKPKRDGWHASASYQHTSSSLTQYHIHESAEANFATSSDENYQPNFTKHLFKSNLQGYITQNLGLTAAFSTTQSNIPLQAYSRSFQSSGSEANSTRDQHRSIYNYYIKLDYNPIESLNLDFNIAYIPQDNTYFMNNARDSFYEMKSGGVQSGAKAIWENNIGIWTNSISYSWLSHTRRADSNVLASWWASSEKNWAIGNNRAVEGNYGDIDQQQHTTSLKSDFSFTQLNFWRTSHNFKTGFDIGYQYVFRNRLEDVYIFGNPANLNGATCGSDSLGLDSCSNASGFVGGTPANQSWSGQYFNRLTRHNAGQYGFGSVNYGIYLEDDINFDFGFGGSINIRPGLRLDGDNYMNKHTLAYRLSLNYITPTDNNYKTTIVMGANRYYGRNLFSYRLYDNNLKMTTILTRTNSNSPWIEGNLGNFTTGTARFQELKVPYDDELMIGISQNIYMFNLNVKYIHREGKDEVMTVNRNILSGEALPDYQPNYITYTNDGRSRSDIITISIQNNEPLEFWNIKNHLSFGFDYTSTSRSYNLISADEDYYDNKEVVYNGQIIRYRDRPAENWARPYTIRLTTTHSFNIWRTRWLWNNFFRYRDGYDRMVLLTRTAPGYNPNLSQYDQYGMMRFNGAFTWDMRIGFEIDVWSKNRLFVNLDIYNVLNTQNLTTVSGSTGAVASGIASSSAIPVYEIGRQFWLEVGYRY